MVEILTSLIKNDVSAHEKLLRLQVIASILCVENKAKRSGKVFRQKVLRKSKRIELFFQQQNFKRLRIKTIKCPYLR